MRLLLPLVLMVGLAACAGSGDDSVSPDEQFGHRYEGIAPDGRETVLIEPADSSAVYIELPVFLDSVHVRSAHREALPGEAVPVEVLIKGALPDACSELNEATQERMEHFVEVTLTVRRPRGAICTEVVRPFRFYLPLDGTFAPGSYSLRINGAAHPFRIREGGVENG